MELGFKTLIIAVVIAVYPAFNLHAEDVEKADKQSKKGLQFFENKIRPVLVDRCYKCHSEGANKIKGGLVLDTREGTRKGGDSGHAVVPGHVKDSLLISAIRHEDYEMPPNGKLPDSVIADFEKWVRMGAPDPRDGSVPESTSEIDVEEGRKYWAFQPPTPQAIPTVQNSSWPKSDIDHFVLAKMESAGLEPVADADKETLLRRVTLDLTGLPPTPEELDAFRNDSSENAFARVVNRLLESERFGERWGRHWLDVVRYAESIGKSRNFSFPFAWRYRDYVIDSFNNDKPYNDFIREQIAGDLLDAEDDEQRNERLTATAFLALGSHDLNTRNAKIFAMDVVGEQIDTVSRAFMGLTVGCARCHDHKFDPIPTSDYYALAGIFKSTELHNGYTARAKNNQYSRPDRFVRLAGAAEETTEVEVKPKETKQDKLARKLSERVESMQAEMKQLQKDSRKLNKNKNVDRAEKQEKLRENRQSRKELQQELAKVQQQLRKIRNRRPQLKLPNYPVTMGVADSSTPENCRINIRGDATRLGAEVERGFLQVISAGEFEIDNKSSGRRELADWLTSPDNPLTARVMANRVWQHLFSRGIVRTSDNFGQMGARPTHPELLDHLANELTNNGGSIKSLIRSIVLSRTYQLSNTFAEENYNIDGDNDYLWRMSKSRLEVEVLRDSILAVSGQLQYERPDGSPVQKLKLGELGRMNTAMKQPSNHRSIYLPIIRSKLPAFLTVFDFPDSTEVRGKRDVTTVPTQALFMMNSPFVLQHSHLAAEQLRERTGSDASRIEFAYQQTLGRSPTDSETERMLTYVKSVRKDLMAQRSKVTSDKKQNRNRRNKRQSQKVKVDVRNPWTDVYHALFASAEFRYRS